VAERVSAAERTFGHDYNGLVFSLHVTHTTAYTAAFRSQPQLALLCQTEVAEGQFSSRLDMDLRMLEVYDATAAARVVDLQAIYRGQKCQQLFLR
jgi:hypothetical protein